MGVEKIRCEELLTGIRLIARFDGEDKILLCASNRCSKALYAFCDAYAEYQKTGVFPAVEDAPDRCPHCGRPYPEGRRYCRFCNRKTTLIKKLMPFLRRYRLQIALVLLTILLSGALDVAAPFLSRKVLYDEVLDPGGSLYGRILTLVAVVYP